jgi:long-chain-fatty-acid--CoA ligase ACSBG
MPLCEVYGLTECTGPETYNLPTRMVPGTAGRPAPETELVIREADERGVGEVCFRGRNVFMGYMGDAEQTRQVLDPDGFLRTGDLGWMGADGFLRIVGRKKELIVTAGGENVAPLLIEAAIGECLPVMGSIVVVGDRRRFLSVILALRCEVSGDGGEVGDQLAVGVLDQLRLIGSSARTPREALRCGRIASYVQGGLERANARALSHAQQVRKWLLIPRELSISRGELTPTMKVKRPVVEAAHAAELDALYSGRAIVGPSASALHGLVCYGVVPDEQQHV